MFLIKIYIFSHLHHLLHLLHPNSPGHALFYVFDVAGALPPIEEIGDESGTWPEAKPDGADYANGGGAIGFKCGGE